MGAPRDPRIEKRRPIVRQLARTGSCDDQGYGRHATADIGDPDVAVVLHVHLGLVADLGDARVVRHEREPPGTAHAVCQAKAMRYDGAQAIGCDEAARSELRIARVGERSNPSHASAPTQHIGHSRALQHARAGSARRIEEDRVEHFAPHGETAIAVAAVAV